MRQLEWKPEYATGIASLDYEHGLLIEAINAACAGMRTSDSRDAVFDHLAQLYERACMHFALEERLMVERKYALYESHKASHEKLADRIREIMDAFEDGMCDTCHKSMDACLLSWFEQHFRTEDGRLQTLSYVLR